MKVLKSVRRSIAPQTPIGLGGHFKLNKANLRFVHSFDHGYFNVGVPNQKLALHPTTDAESLSPTQQIGLCVKK